MTAAEKPAMRKADRGRMPDAVHDLPRRPAAAVAAPSAMDWFTPPLMIPIFFAALLFAYVVLR